MKMPLLISVAFAATACAALAAEPPDNWTKYCTACHGKDGGGHTKAGKKLDVKDLTSADVQKAFTDDEAFTSVKQGMTEKDGTEKMKPFADKLSDDEIKALVAYVRTLAK
jgi:cytochrome c553